MDRRKFVRSTILSGSLLGGALPFENAVMKDESNKKQQWYELRTYLFANDSQPQLTGTYMEQAYLPALNRAGIRNVGVFTELQPQSITRLFLVIPFDSIESFTAINAKLAHDEVYLKAGEAYLAALPTNPAYQRIESSLLKAFIHMPQMEVPEKKDRLFELRCYESPTESAGQKR
jgi:hypothetical protein